jgi:hypothetical protein
MRARALVIRGGLVGWGLALLTLAAPIGWTGCNGLIGSGDGQGRDPDFMGSPDSRRLSPLEVEQTLTDVMTELGVAAPVDDLLLAPPDVRYTFSNTADSGNFTTGQVQNIMLWAESVSLAFSQDLERTMGCTPTTAWEGCASDFATRLGRLVFRRPLEPDELETFRVVYEEVVQQPEGAVASVRALVELAFQSPAFWYLSNETRPDSQQLTSHALASRLSYYLWGTMPDAALRDAADRDELQTSDQIRAHAERLLADPRAEAVVTRFHREWLHVESATTLAKDPALYPSFNPEMAADMDREFDMFVKRNVFEGTIQGLLSSNEGYVNARLESLFGVSNESSGPDDWKWRSLGSERAGILSRPLFLANTAGLGESSLIHRGVAVIEDYLCAILKPPPDAAAEAVEIPPDATSGKMAGVESRASKPRCAACHNTIDRIGVTFEVFDAIGAHRPAYPDGVAIEPAGILDQGIVDEPVSYENAAGLLTALAQLTQVQACYTSKWLQWSTGRSPSNAQREEVARLAESGQQSIRTLLLDVATSPLLTHREAF